MQLSIDFTKLTVPTSSSINVEKLSGQNRRLIEYLLTGSRIHCMHPMMNVLGIGYLNSRIADLRKFLRYEAVSIKQQMIKVNGTSVCEYWVE